MADKLVDEESLKEALTNVKTYVDNNSGGTSYSSFSEASVDEIKEVIEKGLYRTVYHIGDTRKITLSDGYTYTARILDFDSLFNSNGQRVHILIGFDELLADTYQFNSSNTNTGGWASSLLKTNLETLYQTEKDNDIFSLCENSVVFDVASDPQVGIDSVGWTWSTSHFFIPSIVEIFGRDSLWGASDTNLSNYAAAHSSLGHQWKYFKDLIGSGQDLLKNRYFSQLIKYTVTTTEVDPDAGYWYWLRDSYLGNSTCFWGVSGNGRLSSDDASSSSGVAACWCI